MKWARETAAAKVVHVRAFEGGAGKDSLRYKCTRVPTSFLGIPLCVCDIRPEILGEASSGLRDFLPEVLCRGIRTRTTQQVRSHLGSGGERRRELMRRLQTSGQESAGGSRWKGKTDGLTLRARTGSQRRSGRRTSRGCSSETGKQRGVIATLEALAMLLAIRAFFPNAQEAKRTKLVVIPSYTDNRGNGALLNKLMSSKYPLSALLMEFGEQLRHSGVGPDVRWSRETNREADRPANGDSSGFSPAFRLRVLHHQPADGSHWTRHWCLVRQVRTRRRKSTKQRLDRGGRSKASGRSQRTGFA